MNYSENGNGHEPAPRIAEDSRGYIVLYRSRESEELMRDPIAFTLLALIASRARWTDEFNRHGLGRGEALIGIGDARAIGASAREYRTRVERLRTWGFLTTKTTSRGTVAKLVHTGIFSPWANQNDQPNDKRTTSERLANDQRATTKKQDKKEKGKKEKNVPLSPAAPATADRGTRVRGKLADPEGWREWIEATARRNIPYREADNYWIECFERWLNE